MSDDFDAAVAEVGDIDGVAEVAGQAIDLDALLQEGGEGGRVEDAVLGRLGGVDHELLETPRQYLTPPSDSATFPPKAAEWACGGLTFLVIFWFFLGPPFRPPPPAVGLFYMAEIVSVKHLQPTAQDAMVERRQASQGVAAGRQQSEIRTGPATIVSVGLLIWV